MADEEPGVYRDATVERVEILTKCLPGPVDAVLECNERHALDLRHHLARVVGVSGSQGRKGEATVATDHGGHAVPAGRRGQRVPVQLGVVVGVGIDEAWCHHQAADVHHLVQGTGCVDLADLGDGVVDDRNITSESRRTGPVNDRAPLQYHPGAHLGELRGRPSMRSAMMFRCTSVVPP